MTSNKNIILSTTPNLEGYKIKGYYGTVTAHIVAGTGLFSDFAASMSDIFGGRSQSYQKQLISIKDEVLKRLRDEAKVLGANGIVGLRIDFDEISGKGKTMFMVSALGTAVFIESLDKEEDTTKHQIDNISSEKLNIEIKKYRLQTSLGTPDFTLSDDDWEFIIENSVSEVFHPVFNFVNKKSESWLMDNDPLLVTYGKYLECLSNDHLTENIYKLFYAHHKSVRNLAYNQIYERNLLNLKQIKTVLLSDNLTAKKLALRSLYYSDKQTYSKDDIQDYEDIKSLVEEKFPELGDRINKKKLISSTQITNWICPNCSKENSTEEKYCKKCGSNIKGFTQKEVSDLHTIKAIGEKIKILKGLF